MIAKEKRVSVETIEDQIAIAFPKTSAGLFAHIWLIQSSF